MLRKTLTSLSLIGLLLSVGLWGCARTLGFGCASGTEYRYFVHWKRVPYERAKYAGKFEPDGGGVF